VLRRSFLKLTGWAAGVGVLAHHKPGHRGGPPAPTTSTTLPAVDGDLFRDRYDYGPEG
jgi:hypothetical protein